MKILLTMALCATSVFAADANKVFDSQLTGLEKEFVPLVEAMPANQFNFAPKDGAFKGVRTFGLQSKHVAYVLYQISAALLGEKNPSEGGSDENGPANLQTKEEITKYVKDAFAYAHKAVATLTNENLIQETANPFNPKAKSPRLSSATILISHSFDHYGQMVVYARMNNIIPPASR
ncbi:MAG: hypothetical protein QOJ99_193 [Bryobacterales bacterium]|jgi:hypothetical protein|nr:hypothetical protein [Bryobacterales bacterium]